ncbi:SusC/RagA family TonB-linked outer membrane protein [Pedobacter hiemivivus]|uniref:SusC/RagA family TonB-linked outer membrane protein n=1 Tax=Pedobacter hiemivivus TaxID=2530454 RepID=A0A4R0N819_9SPHI|nr:SusC/RagA family TonB-linked outer membrane protein [Pedobacter hiemivivus]TCC96278.1 SusC/RagA family TonB-linked outer membrane protein [Pedobacter hiemivivus]
MKLTFLYNPVFSIRQVKYKLLIVMKLTAILLLIGTMHLSAASYSQSVTVSRKNTTLETVFGDIKKQTGYLFFYSGKVNLNRQILNVELKNVPLEEALKACLTDQNLTFNIVDKTIVVRNKMVDNNIEMANARIDITGKVIDPQTQTGIPGVNITIKGNKSIRAQTNSKGEFKIDAQPGDVLVFTYIGFKEKEVKVGDAKFITVSMEDQVNLMSDVIVTGYQTIKKESYTGNAIVIKGEDLKRTNPQNVLKAIQSFDPSFRLLDNNLAGSDPNAMPRINVRGATALPGMPASNANRDDVLDRNNLSSSFNLPAFILDGFEVSLQKVVDLDINRIASITLLKDAAATAVYGSRAANGVMVITTKAPVAGKLQLSYNYDLTFSGPDLSDYQVLNAKDKIAYEQLAGMYSTGGSSGDVPQDVMDAQLFSRLRNVASGINTYWLSQPLQNSYAQKHSINAQGGDENFRYGIDLRYQTQPGVMKGSTRDRFSGGMNFTYNPSPKLILRNDLSINQTNGVNSPYGSFSTYALMNPYFPKTDSAGRVIQELANWRVNTFRNQDNQYENVRVFNPLFEAGLNNFNKEAYLEIIDAFSADYKLSPSLRIKALVSLNQTNSKSDAFVSPASYQFYDDATDKLNNRGSYRYTTTNRTAVDGTLTINYNKQIQDNSFNLVLGANVLSAKSDFKSVEAQGFSNDRFTNIGFARIYKENSGPGGDVLINRTAGAFFSGNYSYKNKYLMDGSFRMDGSSAFGSNKRFAPFWAAGLGWNIHNEDFLKGSNLISQLRLKASTGTVGSVGFEPYMSRSMYGYYSQNWYSTGVGAYLLGYGNSNLEWQKTTTSDVGLDIGLFKDRVVLSPRYYYKLTKGLITDISLSPSTGFTTYKENLGDMANKGYEIYLTANAINASGWNVNITGNLAHNTNKLVKLSNSLKVLNSRIDDIQSNPNNNENAANGLLSMPLLRYNEGQSLNTIYAVKSLGIDPENGKEIYVKKDGTLTYDYDIKDTQPVGDSTPKFAGNFGSNISYKNFMVSFSFYYRTGGQIYNQTLVDRIENADPRFNVDSRALSQRWVNSGDPALYKNIKDLSLTRASSRFVQKENLIDLQSVYLSYDFKKDLVRKIGFQTLRTAVTMNDIFRVSSVEIERGIDSPFARSITFSLQATF